MNVLFSCWRKPFCASWLGNGDSFTPSTKKKSEDKVDSQTLKNYSKGESRPFFLLWNKNNSMYYLKKRQKAQRLINTFTVGKYVSTHAALVQLWQKSRVQASLLYLQHIPMPHPTSSFNHCMHIHKPKYTHIYISKPIYFYRCLYLPIYMNTSRHLIMLAQKYVLQTKCYIVVLYMWAHHYWQQSLKRKQITSVRAFSIVRLIILLLTIVTHLYSCHNTHRQQHAI